MIRKPKLIVSDIDGTLFEKMEGYSPELDELASYVNEKKIPFTLASGRCIVTIQDILQRFKPSIPYIINNGSAAVGKDGYLWEDFMNPLYLKEAILKADSMGMSVIMSTGKDELVYKYNSYIQKNIDKYGRYNHFYIPLESEWPDLRLQKVLIVDDEDKNRIDEIIKIILPYKDELNILKYNDRSVDVSPKSADKSLAVRRLAKIMSVNMEDVMTIGDSLNDTEMIREAGIGVASYTAVEEVKKVAKVVCKRPLSGGVLDLLKEIYQ
ncbi:MAG: HAD family phosphatase [Sphaerochaetaceae bacterium]|nr:HAD family phosphatase [Sphaerochaetaceae bacterium]